MRYPVQIGQQSGDYHVSFLTVPTLTKTASTKAEVLRLIYDTLLDYLKRTEIFYLDIPTADAVDSSSHQCLAAVGILADDPTLLPMLEEIYAARNDSFVAVQYVLDTDIMTHQQRGHEPVVSKLQQINRPV